MRRCSSVRVLYRYLRTAERLAGAPASRPLVTPQIHTGVFKFNASRANKALELIGKHLGMFVDKHEHAVTNFAISAEPITDPEQWAQGYGPKRN